MNSIICLALSCLLVGLLYVFMRQLFAAQDRKISDLTELVASVVTELQQQTLPPSISPPMPASLPAAPMLEVKRLPERVTVSDDSESESDSDDDGSTTGDRDSDSEEENTKEKVQQKEKEPEPEEEVQVETILRNDVEIEDISLVLDLSEDANTKTINLFETVEPVKPNYEKLTVKELKELAMKQGGPASLKTKKELVEFLEKKI